MITILDEKDLKAIAHLMSILIENEVTPKFDLLADGQKAILEIIGPGSNTEELESRMAALEIAVKRHSRDTSDSKKVN